MATDEQAGNGAGNVRDAVAAVMTRLIVGGTIKLVDEKGMDASAPVVADFIVLHHWGDYVVEIGSPVDLVATDSPQGMALYDARGELVAVSKIPTWQRVYKGDTLHLSPQEAGDAER